MGSLKSKPSRIDKYKDVTEDKIREAAERQRQQHEREERERDERLRQLQLEANRKREELLGYRLGDYHGKHLFENLNMRDMKQRGLRIGLFGPTGSGKSSFINTCERALKPHLRKGTADIQSAGGEGTITLQEFLDDLDSDFCLVDTRGFFRHNTDEFTALKNIIYGRIEPGQEIIFERQTDNTDSEIYFPNCLHAIIIVLSALDPRLKDGNTHRNNLTKLRDFTGQNEIPVITVITHHDKIRKNEEDDILTKASTVTGSSRDHTFFVTNYHVDKTDKDYNLEIEAMKVLRQALVAAEFYVILLKLRGILSWKDQPKTSQLKKTDRHHRYRGARQMPTQPLNMRHGPVIPQDARGSPRETYERRRRRRPKELINDHMTMVTPKPEWQRYPVVARSPFSTARSYDDLYRGRLYDALYASRPRSSYKHAGD